MSVVCSSSNLSELEQLNYDLLAHVYALDLLDNVEIDARSNEYYRLLSDRISILSQTAHDFQTFESALRSGHDFNSSEESELCREAD